MNNIVCLFPCVISIVIIPYGMSRRVNASHLSSKIIGGRDGEKEEYSYMASLQVNEMHICGAGMFQPGFLISSAQCLDEMMKRLKLNLRRGSAVIGHPYLTKGERCDILGLKVHPNFNTSKILEKIRNYDVGVVMVKVPDYMLNLHFPPLQSFPHTSQRNLNGTLCGWGNTEVNSSNANIGTAGFSNILRCTVLRMAVPSLCRSLIVDLVVDYKGKHMCALAYPTQKITLGDIGSPLAMKMYRNNSTNTYITGITIEQRNGDDREFIRFLRVRSVYQQIITMVNDLTSERAANANCAENSQRDLMGGPIKRQKTNIEK